MIDEFNAKVAAFPDDPDADPDRTSVPLPLPGF